MSADFGKTFVEVAGAGKTAVAAGFDKSADSVEVSTRTAEAACAAMHGGNPVA